MNKTLKLLNPVRAIKTSFMPKRKKGTRSQLVLDKYLKESYKRCLARTINKYKKKIKQDKNKICNILYDHLEEEEKDLERNICSARIVNQICKDTLLNMNADAGTDGINIPDGHNVMVQVAEKLNTFKTDAKDPNLKIVNNTVYRYTTRDVVVNDANVTQEVLVDTGGENNTIVLNREFTIFSFKNGDKEGFVVI
jgi:hypothetical protein